MAMSVCILFTSHDRYWPVGSRQYWPCHLATYASASIMDSLVGLESARLQGRGPQTGGRNEVTANLNGRLWGVECGRA
jgi:hypothetical protein